MTKAEVNQLMAIIKVNWPTAFKGLTNNEKKLAFASWFLALKDLPVEATSIAIVKLVATSKWPPTVAEIREKVQSLYYEASYLGRDLVFGEELDPAILAAADRISLQTCSIRGDRISEPRIADLLSSGNSMTLLAEPRGNRSDPYLLDEGSV